jgi:hypothetical protein
MAWYLSILSFLIGVIGIGMISSIPNSFMFLLCVGWTSVSPLRELATAPEKMAAGPLPIRLGARGY